MNSHTVHAQLCATSYPGSACMRRRAITTMVPLTAAARAGSAAPAGGDT
eukprot:CAMPEP_0198575114 /NCGR_PEP_ID=MMETSP1462-20131121/115699_1 /TAXON_ID=1333877 /ORGANISM="Brandtodinium nutriculum, Strain RCC3387" /LENGTH=48 /DNA_ID= /DNA_START= /DNA_END= /DNA_ORIENTATION=